MATRCHDEEACSQQSAGTAPVISALKVFVKDFTAGGFASILSKTAIAPVERVKLLLQVQWVHTDIPPEKRYQGIVDCARRVYTEQGLLSFWRGNLVNVVRYIPSQALNFSLRDRFRALFVGDTAVDDFWRFLGLSLLSGASSGAVTLTVLYPLDFARTRGIRSIYRGFDVAVLGVSTWRALYFGLYDTLSAQLLGGRKGGTFVQRWGLAQVVTTGAGTFVYPIDSVRRRMMMEAGRGTRMYRSSLDCAQRVWKDEGYRGFYRGLSANLARGIGTSVLLVLYDEIRGVFEKL